MKHSELYDKHDDRRKEARRPKKKHTERGDKMERLARTSFKRYVQDLRQSEMEDDLREDFDATDE